MGFLIEKLCKLPPPPSVYIIVYQYVSFCIEKDDSFLV